MSHSRASTYDGSQMNFTFPSSQASSSPSIVTQSNVTIAITDQDYSYGLSRHNSLKRSKAVRSKIGWLTKKIKKFGIKFLVKLKKNWRVINKKRVNLFKRKKSIKVKKNSIKKDNNNVKSITELRNEIDHWYVPQVELVQPPPPPPHRIISQMSELPSSRKSSRSQSIVSKSSSIDEYSIEELVYLYLCKIINDRIKTKLNIDSLKSIPKSRQDSFICQEIFNDNESIASSTFTSNSNTSHSSSISSLNESIVDTINSSIVDSDYYSACSNHYHFPSMPINELKNSIDLNKRASTLPLNSGFNHLRKISEYTVEISTH